MEAKDIRQTVLSEIAKTEKLVEDYKAMTNPIAPDVAIGRISRMDAINNKGVMEAALRQAEEKLKSLRLVLSKFGATDFGLCMKCRKPIPLARILIRPESLHCINCAV